MSKIQQPARRITQKQESLPQQLPEEVVPEKRYYVKNHDLKREETENDFRKMQAVKMLRNWGLKFNGQEDEDAEEFLDELEDCRATAGVNDLDLIQALPCILKKDASIWFRTVRQDLKTWTDFKTVFCNHYVGVYDREDLLDELRRRTQGKGEKISDYLTRFKFIISKFDNPPARRYQVESAYRNLLPSYRKAMSHILVTSFDDIEEFGRSWERQLELDSRYIAPPTVEKMRIKGAAFEAKMTNQQTRGQVAAIDGDEIQAKNVVLSKKKSGKKNKLKKNQDEQTEPVTDAMDAVSSFSNNQPQQPQMRSQSYPNKAQVFDQNWQSQPQVLTQGQPQKQGVSQQQFQPKIQQDWNLPKADVQRQTEDRGQWTPNFAQRENNKIKRIKKS